MAVLGWGMVLCLGLILAVIALPWHVLVEARSGTPRLRLWVRVLGGWAPRIRIPLERRRATPARAKPAKPRRRRARGRRFSGILRLIGGLIGAVDIARLRLEGRFGLPDPAETGMLYGALCPLVQIAQSHGARIDLRPDFSGACLDLVGGGHVVLHPVRIAAALGRFGWQNRKAWGR